MEFEWDPEKNEINRRKHGIEFAEGTALWKDPGLLILPSRYPGETRYLAIGKIGTGCWAAIFTERGEKIRLISIRRARDTEVRLYEQNQE